MTCRLERLDPRCDMSNTPKRILYVEGNVDGTVGGSYYSLFFLAAGLDRSRFKPIVAFATDTPFRQRLKAEHIETVVVPTPEPVVIRGPIGRVVAKGLNFLRGFIVEPWRCAALLRKLDISLLHLNNSIVKNHSWMLAALLAQIPCITHERGINDAFLVRARWLARRLDAVICISAAVRNNFVAHGLGDLRLVLIHNGLDPLKMHVTRPVEEVRRELGVPGTARLVGIVGNIKPWKGQELVIRAMALLRDDFPDLVCLLIGDTSPDAARYRTEILALIDRLGLVDRIMVTGFRRDVADYINTLEIQIHASVEPEPFGRVLLEGMALEKPLVASRGGAVPEIVVDGRTGLLFEPGDSRALADGLRTLLSDPELGLRMGREGRRRLDTEFSIQQNICRTQSLYQSLLT